MNFKKAFSVIGVSFFYAANTFAGGSACEIAKTAIGAQYDDSLDSAIKIQSQMKPAFHEDELASAIDKQLTPKIRTTALKYARDYKAMEAVDLASALDAGYHGTISRKALAHVNSALAPVRKSFGFNETAMFQGYPYLGFGGYPASGWGSAGMGMMGLGMTPTFSSDQPQKYKMLSVTAANGEIRIFACDSFVDPVQSDSSYSCVNFTLAQSGNEMVLTPVKGMMGSLSNMQFAQGIVFINGKPETREQFVERSSSMICRRQALYQEDLSELPREQNKQDTVEHQDEVLKQDPSTQAVEVK